MKKKILFSVKRGHEIIDRVIEGLNSLSNIKLIVHDPTKEYFNIARMNNILSNHDFIIVKVANQNSLNLLYYAKLHGIRTLHDLNSVLICKNKFILDMYLRKILETCGPQFENIHLPTSWNHNLINKIEFREWIIEYMPVVIKSNYQHDPYNRFNFLVRKKEEIDYFYERYSSFITNDVYLQEFIECDGYDRKIYVIGEEIFGIKRENPIYFFLREHPENIDINELKRESFSVPSKIKNLARFLGRELKLKLFGFDLIQKSKGEYYLLDLNEFPGFKGIQNISTKLITFFKNLFLSE
ncbi:MAG: ATP-grasp domain-containing protein [Promethearchaeota archaeon]